MVGEGRIAEVTEDRLVNLMVGRSVDAIFPKRDARGRRGGAAGRRLQPPDRVRRHRLHAPPGRDPRLLRPRRRRPQRVHAGALRHHPAVEGRREDRRPCRGDPLARRGDRAAASSTSPRTAAARAPSAALPIFQNVTLPSLARTSRRGFLRLAEEFAPRPAIHRPAGPARRRARPGRGPALGRQPAEGGDRQVAGDEAPGHHPRRADQGHRRRLQGRRPRVHGRARRAGAGRRHGLLRDPRDPRHVRPRHRHARGPHRRRVRPRRA